MTKGADVKMPNHMPVAIVITFLAATAAAACPPDTLSLYGGPGALEGWFETADGLPDEQGWTHSDDSAPADASHWNVSTVGAELLDPATPGNHAWWCGDLLPACSDTDPAWGYGNDWDEALGWTGRVEPTLPATVRLTGALAVDTEAGYDEVRIEFVVAGARLTAAVYDGQLPPFPLDVAMDFLPGDYFGPDADSVRVQIRVVTDDGWSDEDCRFPTGGAVRADNLQVVIAQEGLPDQASPVETCEPGTPSSWRRLPPVGCGDFAALRQGLAELDAEVDNASPLWAFLDDGLVVPGVGPTWTWSFGYPESTLAVNHSGGLAGLPVILKNSLWSPPIALPEDPCGALVLSFDTYEHSSPCVPTTPAWGLEATSDPGAVEGWTTVGPWDYLVPAQIDYVGSWHRRQGRWETDLLPAGARWVRIRLLALQHPVFCWGVAPTPAPWFDNVRLQLAPAPASAAPAAPDFAVTAAPNPFNPAVTIAWTLPAPARLEARIHDLAGRLVAVLHDGPAPAGGGRAIWRGLDRGGRHAAAGIYVCRVRAGDHAEDVKLVLIR